MTYTEIFIVFFLPVLIASALIYIVSIILINWKPRTRESKPSRKVLECEVRYLEEQLRQERLTNEILTRENYRLRQKRR